MRRLFLALRSKLVRWLEPDGVRALDNPVIRPTPGKPSGYMNAGTEVAFRSEGRALPKRKAWGDIPYEEMAPMFLDQFLLRYFPELLDNTSVQFKSHAAYHEHPPWDTFLAVYPWAKYMPLLFEQLTSYRLNNRQLNEAIGEYLSRLEKTPKKSAAMAICPECNTLIEIYVSNCNCPACSGTNFFAIHYHPDGATCEGSGHGYKAQHAGTPGQHETETTG